MNLSASDFCVDVEQVRTAREVSHHSVVRFCPPAKTHVSVHYPIMLYVSAAALVATFCIYYVVPAQGVLNYVLSRPSTVESPQLARAGGWRPCGS